MLKVRFKNIEYNNVLVLENNNIECNENQLTVITGESGSGKSTLFKALTFHNNWLVSCLIDNVNLVNMNEKDRQEYLFYNFSYVYQEPILLEDLTIQEHIDMLMSLIDSQVNINVYIKKLGLEDKLDQFPKQLSGGEQTRVGILLSLIKDVNIFIYDEPTSSLDDYYSHIVIDILNELKEKGKIVIVFTHDQLIIKDANKRYHIKNHNVECIKDNPLVLIKNKEKTSLSKNISSIQHIFPQMKQHQKKYKMVISMFMTLSIAVVSFGFSFNNKVYSVQQEQMSEMESNELLVFKMSSAFEGQDDYFYDLDEANPFSDEEIKQLQNIKNVELVEWRYDSRLPDYEFSEDLMEVPYNPDEDFSGKMMLVDSKQQNYEIILDNDNPIQLLSYNKDRKSKKDIQYDFGVEGIYVSSTLVNKWSNEFGITKDDLSGSFLEIDLNIPIYNTYGRWQTVTPNDEMVFMYHDTITHERVKVPIAGVVKSGDFGITTYYMDSLYIERNILEEKINQYKRMKPRKLYVIGEDHSKVFLNKCPNEYKNDINRIFEDTPWKPWSFTVYVDGIENLVQVSDEIQELGYCVQSKYVDSNSIGIAIRSMKSAIFQGVLVLGVLTILGAIILEFNNQKSERKIRDYFDQVGLSYQEIRGINRKRFKKNTINEIVRSLVLALIIIVFMNVLTMSGTTPSLYTVLTVVVVSFIIKYIIPMCYMRR